MRDDVEQRGLGEVHVTRIPRRRAGPMDICHLDALDQLLSMLIGGGFLTLFWHWRNDRLAQYRYLDDVYSRLLAEYRASAAAGYGDSAKTQDFRNAFNDDALQYHYFAMTVMN